MSAIWYPVLVVAFILMLAAVTYASEKHGPLLVLGLILLAGTASQFV